MRLKIYAGLIIICVLWGSSWAAVKLGLESVPPLLSVSIRFFIASVILGAIVALRRSALPKDKDFWKLTAILCVTSFTVPFVLIYWAQTKVDSGLASILFSTFPFWVAILSHFLLPSEGITPTRIMGMIVGFLGILMIFQNEFTDISVETLFGMIAIVIGSVIQASGLIALRRFGRQMDPVVLNLWSMAAGVLPLFAASIATEDYANVFFDVKAVGSLIYLSVFCTVITFVIYFWLVKHVEAVILSFTAFITPVIAMFIAVLLMQEMFTPAFYIGSALVLGGVAIALIGDFIHPNHLGSKII